MVNLFFLGPSIALWPSWHGALGPTLMVAPLLIKKIKEKGVRRQRQASTLAFNHTQEVCLLLVEAKKTSG